MSYSLDAYGNQVSKGKSQHMGWDFGDRMWTYFAHTGASEPTVYAHYLYGADGNRVKKLERKSAGNEEVSVYTDGGLLTVVFSPRRTCVFRNSSIFMNSRAPGVMRKSTRSMSPRSTISRWTDGGAFSE